MLTQHLAEIISLAREFKEDSQFALELTLEEFQDACHGMNHAARTPTWFHYEDHRYGFFPAWDNGGLKTIIVWTHDTNPPFTKKRVGELFLITIPKE